MAKHTYRLSCTLRLTGPNAGTKHNEVNIVAQNPEEAIALAQFYHSSLPSAAHSRTILTDTTGRIIWSEGDAGVENVKLQ